MKIRAASLAAALLIVGCSSDAKAGDQGSAVPAERTAVSGAVDHRDTIASAGGQANTDGPSTATTIDVSAAEGSAPCDGPRPAVGDPFEDRTVVLGLDTALAGIRGHATAVGDVDGDGFLDLFVGTFADRPAEDYRVRGADGPAPDRLLLGSAEGFSIDEDFPGALGRSSGAAFADLDADGDLELVIGRNVREGERRDAPSVILRNDGGRFGEPIELDTSRSTRSIGVLDYDADGLLDLFLVVDRFGEGGSVLLRNKGDLKFEDVTSSAGLPTDLAGLGVATVDLDRNTTPDLFVAGDNRLFTNDGGRFREVEGPFDWETFGAEDDTAGVSVGDVNADGWLDLVVGHHYNSTLDFGERVPVRLYLNRGLESGNVVFDDVTSEAGLAALPTKAPHVQVVDIDGDGDADIVTTASANDGAFPALLLSDGDSGSSGVPTFSEPEALGSAQYWVAGAVFDADADGAPEIFVVEWEPELGSRLIEAPAPSGQWVSVRVVDGTLGGVGTIIEAYEAGQIGDTDGLVATVPIVASTGYGSGTDTAALIGIGSRSTVDLVVIAPNDGGRFEFTDVPAGASMVIADGTASVLCR